MSEVVGKVESVDWESMSHTTHVLQVARMVKRVQQSIAKRRESREEFERLEQEVAQKLHARRAARAAKNWAESDRIRDELAAMGIQLKDGKDPATGEPVTTWEVKR